MTDPSLTLSVHGKTSHKCISEPVVDVVAEHGLAVKRASFPPFVSCDGVASGMQRAMGHVR